MSFTKKQKAAIKALVSCHETGKPIGDYSKLVVLTDDAGITYGSHQSTHRSGSLYKIVHMYVNISKSETAKALVPYLSGLKQPSLRHRYAQDTKLKSLLIKAGKEPAMRYAQDKVFEVNYFEPALRAVEGSGWTTALALAVVYDSMIQGGWLTVRDRVKTASEKTWIKNYVAARRRWLGSSKRKIVRNSVYRMTTFEKLIANDNWDLDTPFVVHGVKVTDVHLATWMAADNPTQNITEEGEAEVVEVDVPAPNYFVGNTEGIAEDDSVSEIWDSDIDVIEDVDDTESKDTDVTLPDNPAIGEPEAPAGEPAPEIPAKEGEAIVGGRPQDTPIIVDTPPEERPSGIKTGLTTVTAVLGSLGLSAGGVFTQLSGIELSPQAQEMVGWVIIVALVVAAAFGLFYLISRMKATSAEKQRKHELLMRELEIRSAPHLYNVKVDRRGDMSNVSTSGVPFVADRRN